MKIGFYPGCSLEGTSREYNESVRAVCAALGIDLVEIKDWNCCGATAAHSMDRVLSLSLPARVLALAESQGFEEVVVPCASCYNRLCSTLHKLQGDGKLREEIEAVIGMKLACKADVLNVLQFVDKYVSGVLPSKIVKPFAYKVACYYGCLLVRPRKATGFDRLEDPQSMDKIMATLGATPIDWAFKTECCGAGLSVSRTDLVGRLSGDVLDDAVDRGAEAVIVACPMCHSNLDMRRGAVDKYVGRHIATPVIYVTQAIGLAIGLPAGRLGLQRHFVNVNLKEA